METVLVVGAVVSTLAVLVWIALLIWAAVQDGRDQRARRPRP